MMPRTVICALATALMVGPVWGKHHHYHHRGDDQFRGLADTTLLVVRHAEKPPMEGDPGLSPAGEARAKAYATYFRHFMIDGSQVHVRALIASADSPVSARPRLTLEPLSKATGLPIRQPFSNKRFEDAAEWLESGAAQVHGAAVIAWHHGKIAKLLQALGADPAGLLPGGVWPEDVYNWVIVLHYGDDGRLTNARRLVEPDKLN